MSRYASRTRASSRVSTWLPAGVEPFTPSYVNPILWLDASDSSTITASSGAVSQWNNKGSLGNFTQATAANQPTTGSVTQNGLNVISFDGNDRVTAVTSAEWKPLHDGTVWLLVAAWQPGTSSNPATQYPLLGNNAGSSGAIGATVWYEDSSVNNGYAVFVTAAPGGAPVSASTANILTPNQMSITSNLVTPSDATAANRNITQINGGTEYKVNTLTNAVSASNPSHALQIGTFGNNAGGMVGRVAELVIATGSDATVANRDKLVAYLNAKWAVY